MSSTRENPHVEIPPQYLPATEYADRFAALIKAKPGLQRFYSPEALEDITKEAKLMGDALMDQGCSGGQAVALSMLTLYDIAMLVGWFFVPSRVHVRSWLC